MSKSRDIADSAATINYIDNVTSDVQSQINTLDTALDNISVTSGTLTKTFAHNESVTIDLTSSVVAPVVSVTKEVPQTGVTNNNWDVNSTSENYTRLDSAYATTLTPSATGDGTFTLGTGSFAAADVGKTISGNGGVAVLTATDGSYVTTTDFADTSAIASGSWSMYGVVYNAIDGDLEISSLLDGAFDVSTASYSQRYSAVTGQTAVAFNTDGTKMFILSLSNDAVNEYALSTGFDVSTASYSTNFSVSSQDTSPSGLAFNSDGTRMFVLGKSNRKVSQYLLTTGFDVDTAAYSQNFDVLSQDSNPTGVTFNTDGTKMYVSGISGQDINQYNLSTAFDVSTATYIQNFVVSSQETIPEDVRFNADGSKMFVLGSSGDSVHEYSLSTGFDISTASYSQSFSVASQTLKPFGLAFNPDGTKMFIADENSAYINEYDLGAFIFVSGYQPVHTTASIDSTYWTDINSMTADQNAGDGNVYYAISTDDRTTWTVIDNTDGERDIVRNNAGTWQYNSNGTYASETWTNATTNTELAALAEAMEGATFTENSYDVSTSVYVQLTTATSQDTVCRDVQFSSDGTKMYVLGQGTQTVYQYTLSTAFDVSTSTYASKSFAVSGQESGCQGIFFKTDGTKMYVVGTTNDRAYQYTLSTAWDISTASYDSVNISVGGNPKGIAFSTDGTVMFIATAYDQYEYSLSTAWDVSSATLNTPTVSTLGQDNDATGLAFNNDGTKFYIIGNQSDSVFEYDLSTAWDLHSLTYNQSFSVASQNTSPNGITFNSDGSKMYMISQNSGIYEYTLGTTGYTNQMDKTQLDAVTDPNHIALGNDLDLAIVFNMTSGTTVPSSDGVAINYDANVLNKGAVLGTDYDFDAPTQNSVRITALAANNLKVRVV